MKFGLSAEQLLSTVNASVPDSIKIEIIARISEVLLGDAPSFAGDPENIDGYRPVYDAEGVVIVQPLSSTSERLIQPALRS